MIGLIRYIFASRNYLAIISIFIVFLFVFAGASAGFLFDYSKINSINLRNTLTPPSLAYPLGTDEMGRDLLPRIAWGARITLTLAFVSVASSVVLGVAIGTLAGFYRGLFAGFLVRFIDGMAGFPRVLLAIVMLTIVGPGVVGLTLAIALSTMPVFARLYYAEVRSLKSQEFVLAARTLGASDWSLIATHILPNTIPMLVVQASICLAEAILIASGLSFLGLGPQPPTPEWGAMIASARAHVLSSPHVIYVPGMALFMVVLAFNILGDALRDYLDPKVSKLKISPAQ